VTSRH